MAQDRTQDPREPHHLTWLLSDEAARLFEELMTTERVASESEPGVRELIDASLVTRVTSSSDYFANEPVAALIRSIRSALTTWVDAFPRIERTLASLDGLVLSRSSVNGLEGTVDDSARDRQRASNTLEFEAIDSIEALQPFPDWIPYDELADPDAWANAPYDRREGFVNRWVYADRLLELPGFREAVDAEVERGYEVRFTRASLPTFLVIADRSRASFFPAGRGPGTVTSEPAHVGLLSLAFEQAWSRAVPYSPGGRLSASHEQVHSLLALGHNNRVIATMLGLNERTIRRRVDELLDHYGLSTRTELVLVASKRSLDTPLG